LGGKGKKKEISIKRISTSYGIKKKIIFVPAGFSPFRTPSPPPRGRFPTKTKQEKSQKAFEKSKKRDD
jgi:hypothetical protein